ncbi:280_t:CDS:2 [Cetraspora pellucida]|uniref:280_t:CDS:1 n=1 Tax=Cetraspora pellucida TaxID=1433469 RepID=A0A9N9FGP3_9GLOM|nr:280_t:CDS:2 [Cetraspora pellucida]
MSSTPWKPILKSLISENIKILKSTIPILPMQFSTFDASTCRPTNRTVMFRGFLGEKNNGIHKNELVEYLNSMSSEISLKGINPEIETDLLVITTDIRTPKVKHLLENPGFEVCWLSGNAYVLPPPTNPILAHFPSNLLHPYSFSVNLTSLIDQFDWEQERKRYWYETSSDLRARFLMPPSAQEINEGEIQKVVRELDSIGKNMDEILLVNKALENFGLIVMKVDYVDHLELKLTHNRTIWKLQKSVDLNKEEWVKKDVVP